MKSPVNKEFSFCFPPFALQKTAFFSICFTKNFAVFETIFSWYWRISSIYKRNSHKIAKVTQKLLFWFHRGSDPQGAATTTFPQGHIQNWNQYRMCPPVGGMPFGGRGECYSHTGEMFYPRLGNVRGKCFFIISSRRLRRGLSIMNVSANRGMVQFYKWVFECHTISAAHKQINSLQYKNIPVRDNIFPRRAFPPQSIPRRGRIPIVYHLYFILKGVHRV